MPTRRPLFPVWFLRFFHQSLSSISTSMQFSVIFQFLSWVTRQQQTLRHQTCESSWRRADCYIPALLIYFFLKAGSDSDTNKDSNVWIIWRLEAVHNSVFSCEERRRELQGYVLTCTFTPTHHTSHRFNFRFKRLKGQSLAWEMQNWPLFLVPA